RSRPCSARAGVIVAADIGGMRIRAYATLPMGPRALTSAERWRLVRHDGDMTANGHHIIRLEFSSAFEMLDFVQVVSDHLARGVGLDEDSLHWVSVAIRESVINAIKHGNRNDVDKHVFVEFETATRSDVGEFAIRV